MSDAEHLEKVVEKTGELDDVSGTTKNPPLSNILKKTRAILVAKANSLPNQPKPTEKNATKGKGAKSMASISYVESIDKPSNSDESYQTWITLWSKQTPSYFKWWNDETTVGFEISFRNVVGDIELKTSSLYLRITVESFTMHYVTEDSVVCMDKYLLLYDVIPSATTWNFKGLTLTIKLTKVEARFWDNPTPFLTENGDPLRRPWIRVDPMKMATEDDDDDEIAKDAVSLPGLVSSEGKENIGVACWEEDYISEKDDGLTSEDSDSDESNAGIESNRQN